MYCPICDQKPMNCDCTPEERRMHAEIEELEEQVPRWIPVTERLPEVHAAVLAVTRAFPKDIRLAQMASHDGVMWRFCGMDDDDVDSFGITHWMPLPAPPSGGTETVEK
jgi:hypothetical protein